MNVLSIPTWLIHVTSVLEWATAMILIWSYAGQQPSLKKPWQNLALAMIPALVSAMCACTWHFFDNSIHLEWLVTVQAALTLVGNTTLAIAGYSLYKAR